MYSYVSYIGYLVTFVLAVAAYTYDYRRQRLNKWTAVAILGFALLSVSISGSLPNKLRFLHYKSLFAADTLEVVLQNAPAVSVEFSTLFDDGTPRFGVVYYGTTVRDLVHYGPTRIGEIVLWKEGNSIGTMAVWQLTENLHEVPNPMSLIGPVYRINSHYYVFSGTTFMTRNVLYAFQDTFFQAILDLVVVRP